MIKTCHLSLVLASLASATHAQGYYGPGYGGYYGGRGLAGGSIAGIVVGSVLFLLLLCCLSTMCVRRRRGVHPIPFYGSRQGRNAGVTDLGAQEAGYGHPQSGWNSNAQPAAGYAQNQPGQYKPPSGQPPAPPPAYSNGDGYQPGVGGFAPPPGEPPVAHTR